MSEAQMITEYLKTHVVKVIPSQKENTKEVKINTTGPKVSKSMA